MFHFNNKTKIVLKTPSKAYRYLLFSGYFNVCFNDTDDSNASLLLLTDVAGEFISLSYNFQLYKNPPNFTTFSLTKSKDGLEASICIGNQLRKFNLVGGEEISLYFARILEALNSARKGLVFSPEQESNQAESLTRDFKEQIDKIFGALKMTGNEGEVKVDSAVISDAFSAICKRFGEELEKIKKISSQSTTEAARGFRR